MIYTTSFTDWLSFFDKDFLKELVALKSSVEEKRSVAPCEVKVCREGWMVSYPGVPKVLFLANDNARLKFLKALKEQFGDVEFQDAIEDNH